MTLPSSSPPKVINSTLRCLPTATPVFLPFPLLFLLNVSSFLIYLLQQPPRWSPSVNPLNTLPERTLIRRRDRSATQDPLMDSHCLPNEVKLVMVFRARSTSQSEAQLRFHLMKPFDYCVNIPSFGHLKEILEKLLLTYNSYKLHHFKVYCSMAFSIFRAVDHPH